MKVIRNLKHAMFEYDEEEKSITIETRTTTPIPRTQDEIEAGAEEVFATDGRVKLNKVYSFALLRFVIRIAQRNWFRKWKK